MEILGYISAILIGVALGLVGSGGSIITVPVLVYLMHINPLVATASSLFIVGITSLIGGIKAYSEKMVDFKAVTEFGIPSILSIFIARHFILPALPDTMFTINNFIVSRETFLMVVFGFLMLFASLSLIRNKKRSDLHTEDHTENKVLPLIILGLLIGLITGLLGAGGGFLIIPALILFLGLPMKKAVGTSLLIIAINSIFGFLFSLKQFEYNWLLLVVFTLLSIAGIFIGRRLSEKIPSEKLKKGFGWFILLMSIYIIIKELAFNG
jgi:uncharacterized protein